MILTVIVIWMCFHFWRAAYTSGAGCPRWSSRQWWLWIIGGLVIWAAYRAGLVVINNSYYVRVDAALIVAQAVGGMIIPLVGAAVFWLIGRSKRPAMQNHNTAIRPGEKI